MLSLLIAVALPQVACTNSTGPDKNIDAAWMPEQPAVYQYGFTGAQVMWAFFEANTTAAPKVSAKIIGGSSISMIDTPTQAVYQVSTGRMLFRTDIVFSTLRPGISCFELKIENGPTTERCVAVSLSGKGNLQVSGM